MQKKAKIAKSSKIKKKCQKCKKNAKNAKNAKYTKKIDEKQNNPKASKIEVTRNSTLTHLSALCACFISFCISPLSSTLETLSGVDIFF